MSRFLKSSSGKSSALLQKANAQLRGERVTKPKNEDDDELGDYLSGLGTRQSKEVQWDKFGDLSDISISSDDQPKLQQAVTPSPASKFLKKKPENDAGKPDAKKPALSGGTPQYSKTTSPTKREFSKSSVLDKAAKFTSKYKAASQAKKSVPVLSDSDMDMDISLDEEIVNDVRVMKGQNSVTEESQDVTTSFKRKPSLVRSASSLSDDSDVGRSGSKFLKKKFPSEEIKSIQKEDRDSDVGGSGNRFLKKKKNADPVEEEPKKHVSHSAQSGKAASKFTLPSAAKYSTAVTLDTDEESLADFIGGLSPASSADISGAKTPRGLKPGKKQVPLKSPKSPKSPKTLRQSPEPMEEIQEVEEDSAKSVSSMEDNFQFNVLDLGSLEPAVTPRPAKKTSSGKGLQKTSKHTPTKNVSLKKSEKKKDKGGSALGGSSDFFNSMGLMSVDDLLGSDKEVSEASEATVVSEEIVGARQSPPLRSILSPTPRSATPKSARGRVRLSLGDISEIHSRSPSPEAISTGRPNTNGRYSDDFDETEEIHTAKSDSEVETISEHSVSSGRSTPVRSVRSTKHRSRASSRSSRRKSEDYYSDDFSSSTGVTSRSRRSLSTRSSSYDSATYSDTYASYTEDTEGSRTPSPRCRSSDTRRRSSSDHSRRLSEHRKVKTRTTQVQTGLDPGLLYHWNLSNGPTAAIGPAYGLGTVDPTPMATHVVSADALEALTAYSPSVLALNDMLRSQLQLTRNFMDMQRHMHRSYVGSMDTSGHHYTTLEDTKRYIKKHKKPKLTFDEALKKVKLDMGLDT